MPALALSPRSLHDASEFGWRTYDAYARDRARGWVKAILAAKPDNGFELAKAIGEAGKTGARYDIPLLRRRFDAMFAVYAAAVAKAA